MNPKEGGGARGFELLEFAYLALPHHLISSNETLLKSVRYSNESLI